MEPTDNLPSAEPAEYDLNDATDKIASLLTPADEQPEEKATEAPTQDATPAEESPSEEPSLEEVEYEGKQYKLPQELKDALLRQADYTRKTQEVAELRKQVEPLYEQGQRYAQLAANVGPLIGQYQMLAQRLQHYNTPDTMQRWATLQNSDPLAYFAERDEQRQAEQALMHVQGQLNAATQQMQQAEVNRLTTLTQEGAKVLASRITDWGPDKAKALTQYASKEFGFSPQELQTVVDPRMVLVLHKAHLYDQLQAKQPQVAKQVQKAPPKVVKSNPATDPSDSPSLNQAAMQRLRRSGSLDDATAAIASLLS